MRTLACCIALGLTACGGSGGVLGSSSGDPISPRGVPLELVFARSRIDQRSQDSTLRASDLRSIRDERVLDRAGIESGVRVHPDGEQIVFVRERTIDDESSREIYRARIDGGIQEVRLTSDQNVDDTPCWSPDGSTILFASDRLGQGPRLFLMDPDGTNLRPLQDLGDDQTSPDWSAANDSVVFSRTDRATPGARAELWIVDGAGRNSFAITDGGTVGLGDFEPAWSPDGSQVLFVRRLTDELSTLMLLDVGSRAVTPLPGPAASTSSRPRWSPAGDRIIFTRSAPELGIATEQLWQARPDGTDATLLLFDERYDYPGFDLLPDVAALPASSTTDVLIEEDDFALRLGRRSTGEASFAIERDGAVLGLSTVTFDGQDRAGIDVSFALGSPAQDIQNVRIALTVAVTPIDDESLIRIAVQNVVTRRNDTLLELTPTDEMLNTIEFDVGSLAHVDRSGGLRISIISEKSDDEGGQLFIDAVSARVTTALPDSDD